MKYLITGATGFIGPYLIRQLIKAGHTCRCLVRKTSDTHSLKSLGTELVIGDVTLPSSLTGIADTMDGIFHLATLGHLSHYKVPDSIFEEVNVQGTLNIMKEAIKSGVNKIVHCSSTAAMGICKDIPTTEKSICQPYHPYGKSKLKAEKHILQMVSKESLPAVIVRLSMVYGPGNQQDVLKLTRLAKKGLLPKIGNKPKLTPLIHIDDATEAIILAFQKGRIGETYLITNTHPEPFDKICKNIIDSLAVKRPTLFLPEWSALVIASLCEILYRLFGKQPPITLNNIRSTLSDRVFSIEKATYDLGFLPKIDPSEGLKETVRWYTENNWV